MHQFLELEKEKEMQDKFTWIHSDLTQRQDNVIWIVREQKAAHFPAGRGRTTLIENKNHSVHAILEPGITFLKCTSTMTM